VTDLESDVLENGKAGDLGLCPHSCCIYFLCAIWRLEDVLSTLFIVCAQSRFLLCHLVFKLLLREVR
jgi:hypothetical protein